MMLKCHRCRKNTHARKDKPNRCSECGNAYRGYYRPPQEVVDRMDSRGIVEVFVSERTRRRA